MDRPLDESEAASYIMTHVRNQLSFDLWYIFLGTFCICVAESGRIKDLGEPVSSPFNRVILFYSIVLTQSAQAFSVFSVFFEVVSA